MAKKKKQRRAKGWLGQAKPQAIRAKLAQQEQLPIEDLRERHWRYLEPNARRAMARSKKEHKL